MMGNKIDLIMSWKVPEDKNEWNLEVHPNGVVSVRFYDPITKIIGTMNFPEDADIEFVKGILGRIGFSPKQHE